MRSKPRTLARRPGSTVRPTPAALGVLRRSAGLALVAEYGVEKPWDCPHCRDPHRPKSPLYTHIGHRPGTLECGKYDHCVFERGSFSSRKVRDDPVFAGLPDEFPVMESHCGQIAWAPKGWQLIATAGPDGLTKTQCLCPKRGLVHLMPRPGQIRQESPPGGAGLDRTIAQNVSAPGGAQLSDQGPAGPTAQFSKLRLLPGKMYRSPLIDPNHK